MHKYISSWKMEHPHRIPLLVLIIGLLFVITVSLACNAPGNDESPKDTQIMQNLQETKLALQDDQVNEQSGESNQSSNAMEASPTVQTATQVVEDPPITTDDQAPEGDVIATDTPIPTEIPPPTPTLEPTPTNPPPTPLPENASMNMEELMKDADILLFENVTKIPLPRYIKQALDNLGLSRNYVDVKDAPGNFKAQLLSGIDWDLIIVGVEARSSIQGEFFDYFNDEINKGTALVLEIWNLDEIAGTKATSFLTNCGLKVQGDWYDPPMTARSIWWLYGEHDVFHEPNEGMSLVNYNPYWAGDAGDLIKTIPGGDATLLAGTYAQEKNSYGVLAICHDDRVIIQTYSSHDYRQSDVVRLWENYIYNALRAHFEHTSGQ